MVHFDIKFAFWTTIWITKIPWFQENNPFLTEIRHFLSEIIIFISKLTYFDLTFFMKVFELKSLDLKIH